VSDELIRPIDSDTAHAIEETAKTAGKAIDAVAGTDKYFSQVVGRRSLHPILVRPDFLEAA
jgi:hypothetical protein